MQPVLKRFIFKLRQLTTFRAYNQLKDSQFEILGDLTNFYQQDDFDYEPDNFNEKVQAVFKKVNIRFSF